MAFFDQGAPTALHTDASRTRGLGFVLRQRQEGAWKMIQCGSRFLTDTESRYSVIELECLAVMWACHKCHVYLAGLPHFDLVVDQRPLVPILNSKRLAEIENSRLQRLREKCNSLETVLDTLGTWFMQNGMMVNARKTELILCGDRRQLSRIEESPVISYHGTATKMFDNCKKPRCDF